MTSVTETYGTLDNWHLDIGPRHPTIKQNGSFSAGLLLTEDHEIVIASSTENETLEERTETKGEIKFLDVTKSEDCPNDSEVDTYLLKISELSHARASALCFRLTGLRSKLKDPDERMQVINEINSFIETPCH